LLTYNFKNNKTYIMKKLKLTFSSSEMLTKDQMKNINGGSSCEALCQYGTSPQTISNCTGICQATNNDGAYCNNPPQSKACQKAPSY
jgi:hypothetical protein